MVQLLVSDVWTYAGVIAVIAIVGVWVWLEKKYRYKVIVKDVVGSNVIIKIFRARRWVDKAKSMFWKLAGEKDKEKKLLPLPPDEVIIIDHKGKKWAQCFRFESGEIVWCKDNWKAMNIVPKFEVPDELQLKIDAEPDFGKKKELIDKFQRDAKRNWMKDNNIVTPYQPVTTNQRLSYFYNIQKAESRKGFDWKEKIVPITAMAVLGIIILGLFIFWGEIAAPALKANEQAIMIARINNENLQILKEIKTGQQRIEDKIETVQPSNVPN